MLHEFENMFFVSIFFDPDPQIGTAIPYSATKKCLAWLHGKKKTTYI